MKESSHQSMDVKIAKLEVMVEDVRANVREIKDNQSEGNGRFEEKINMLIKKFSEIEDRFESKFALKEDVGFLKRIVYGAVGFILIWFLTQIANLIPVMNK